MAGYGTDEDFQAYAEGAGQTVPTAGLAALRQRGSAYIDGLYGARFSGVPTAGVQQERAWPRSGATAFCQSIASDLVPLRVEQASYEAALIEARSPGSLSIVVDPSKRVKRQKVEGIEREFFDPGAGLDGSSIGPVSSVIDGLLAPLLTPEPANIGLWSIG